MIFLPIISIVVVADKFTMHYFLIFLPIRKLKKKVLTVFFCNSRLQLTKQCTSGHVIFDFFLRTFAKEKKKKKGKKNKKKTPKQNSTQFSHGQ